MKIMKLINCRRKRYIIKKDMQFRYTGKVLLMMLLTTIITGYTITCSFLVALNEPEMFLKILAKNLLISGIASALTITIFCIFFSHQIAGPLYRLELYIREIGKGNFSEKIKIRKDDDLKSLEKELDNMVNNFRNLLKEDKKTLQEIITFLEELKGLVKTAVLPQEKLDQLEKKIMNIEKECENSLAKYKL